MQKNSKIVILLMAVLSLTACEVEREVLKASHEPDEPAGETFNGKKIIKEGTPEYERLVKNGVMLKSEGIAPGSLSQKGPNKASRNGSGEKVFELPVDLLYEWGVNTGNLQKLTIKDGCPGFGTFAQAAKTTVFHVPNILFPNDSNMQHQMQSWYKNYTNTINTSKYGEEWWSVPQQDNSLFERYLYKKFLNNVVLKFPTDIYVLLRNAYDPVKGNDVDSHAAYGYYIQDNLKGGDFKNEFLNNTYNNGYYYNFGIWKDIPLMFGVYNTGYTNNPYGFMNYTSTQWNISKTAASKEPYRNWHPGKKSGIQGKYQNAEKEVKYNGGQGDLVFIKSDEMNNTTSVDQNFWSDFNEQEEETVTTTNSTSNSFTAGISLTYDYTWGLAGISQKKISVSAKFEYSHNRTSSTATSNRKLKSYSTSARVVVPAGKHYQVELYSYANKVNFRQGAYLKVFQKLFNDRNNFQVPPFISLNQSTWEPLVNVPLRVFASKSGLAKGYKDRYLYTGIDYSGDPQNNINAYDLLYMGDVEVAINTMGAMNKMIIVRDVTDPSNPTDVTGTAVLETKKIKYEN